ncbi:MAG TPA: hypothetical protein VMX55_10505 [candidate division Zixibacteria bacterium]|nr:hypothetical protein [candidate division Zixibacteria bacterium]
MENIYRIKKFFVFFVIINCLLTPSILNFTKPIDNRNKSIISASSIDNGCEEICRFFEGYRIEDFVVRNNFVFLAIGYEGFLIIDISIKENPVVVYQELINGNAKMILCEGNYIYLTVLGYEYDSPESYVFVYEINNPNNPVKLSQTKISYLFINEMIFNNNYLYLIGDSKFYVINIENPNNPLIIYESLDGDSDDSKKGLILGDYLLLYIYPKITVYNISNPYQPVYIDYSMLQYNSTYGLFLYDFYSIEQFIYGSCYWGLVVLNATDPTNMTLINVIDNDLKEYNAYSNILVEDNYLFYSESGRGVRIFNKNNITHPTFAGFYNETSYDADYSLDVELGYLFIDFGKLHIVDISEIEKPEVIGYIGDEGWAYSVAVKDNFAYLADGNGGLKIVTLENWENPKIIGRYPGFDFYDIEIVDNYAFICCRNNGFKIIDVSDKANPKLEKEYTSFYYDKFNISFFREIYILDNYAFIACDTYGVLILDISNPKSLVVIGLYNEIWCASWVYAVNNIVYTSTHFKDVGLYGPMHIIDIENKSGPTKISEMKSESGPISDVEVSGKYTFFAWGSTIKTMNMQNSLNPRNISSTNTTNSVSYSLCITGKYVFVCGQYLEIFDMHNPKEAINITTYIDCNYSGRWFGNPSSSRGTLMNEVEVIDNYAIVAYGAHGFMILQLPISTTGKIGTRTIFYSILSVLIITLLHNKRKKK